MTQAVSSKTRILIVDDHPTIRMALRQILALKGIQNECIFEASDLNGAIQTISATEPHFVILDLHLRGQSGHDLLRQYSSELKIKFIIYTQSDEVYNLKEALRLGAYSILKKEVSIEALSEQLERVLNEQKIFPQQLMESELTLAEMGLTGRELEIAHFIAQGRSNKEIAEILRCSDQTVKTHRSSILKKVGVDNSVAATVLLVKQGLL